MTKKEAMEFIYCLAEQGCIQDDPMLMVDEDLQREADRQEEAMQIFHEFCNFTFDGFLESHKL